MANKKFWIRILVMVLVFGMTVVGNLEAQTDNRLNGAWFQIEEGTEFELRLRDGNFEELYNGVSWRRGTFTANGREITVVPTHIFGGGADVIFGAFGIDFGFDSKWYSVNEFIITVRSALLRMGASESEANEFVNSALSANTTSNYSVDGNTLILVSTVLGQSYTIILTKK